MSSKTKFVFDCNTDHIPSWMNYWGVNVKDYLGDDSPAYRDLPRTVVFSDADPTDPNNPLNQDDDFSFCQVRWGSWQGKPEVFEYYVLDHSTHIIDHYDPEMAGGVTKVADEWIIYVPVLHMGSGDDVLFRSEDEELARKVGDAIFNYYHEIMPGDADFLIRNPDGSEEQIDPIGRAEAGIPS